LSFWRVDQRVVAILIPLVIASVYRLTLNAASYIMPAMIQSFKCPDTQALFAGIAVARLVNIRAVAERKLQMLHRSTRLDDLRVPPNNGLEALKRDRKGQHSIRVNDQWRVCFVWTGTDARDVEIVDYH
jgi:proteic killer suppression protein